MKLQKGIALCLALLLALSGLALAEEPPAVTLFTQTYEAPLGSIAYPQVTGLEDASIQAQVNALLLEAGQVESRINRLTSLQEGTAGLTLTYQAFLEGDILSVAFCATGALRDLQPSQEYATVNVDLRTGEVIPLDALFLDGEAVRTFLTAYLEEQVAPELSPHLEYSQLTPLPETYALTAEGITFYYTAERFMTLSGRVGSVTVYYTELQELLNLEDVSILGRTQAVRALTLDENNAQRIRASVEAGMLPGIPTVVGESMNELIERSPMLIDPDYYPGGRFFQLEDAAFRAVLILTDALTQGWDHSVVQGIRTDRVNFYGLCTGTTTRENWQAVLGAPDASVTLSEEDAYAHYLEVGTSDYYNLGNYQLRLHADAAGVLRSVFVTR